MPARTLPNLGLRGFYDDGEDGWGDNLSADLLKLSVLTQGGVKGRVAAVPGGPAAGDTYVLTAAPNANAVAVYDVGAWVYYTPSEGWLLYDQGTDEYISFDGAAWVVLATGTDGGDGGGDNGVRAVAVGYRVLKKIDLTGLAAFSFDNIPQTGASLRLVISGKLTAGSDIALRMNGVADGVYDTQRAYENKARQNDVASDHFRGETQWSRFPTFNGAGNPATAVVQLDFDNYAQSNSWKTGMFAGRQPDEDATAAYAMSGSFQARINAAIMSLQGTTNGATFLAGSTATLYVLGENDSPTTVRPFSGARVKRTEALAYGGNDTSLFAGTGNVVEYDEGGWWSDAERLFIIPAGVTKVLVNASLFMTGGNNFGLRISKNGTLTSPVGDGVSPVFKNGSVVLPVVAGDKILVAGYSNGGNTLSNDFCHASITALAMTPVQVAESGGDNVTGWRREADGWIEQWGYYKNGANGNPDIVFPIPFTQIPVMIHGVCVEANAAGDNTSWNMGVSNVTKTQFRAHFRYLQSGGVGIPGEAFRWSARGK